MPNLGAVIYEVTTLNMSELKRLCISIEYPSKSYGTSSLDMTGKIFVPIPLI